MSDKHGNVNIVLLMLFSPVLTLECRNLGLLLIQYV